MHLIGLMSASIIHLSNLNYCRNRLVLAVYHTLESLKWNVSFMYVPCVIGRESLRFRFSQVAAEEDRSTRGEVTWPEECRLDQSTCSTTSGQTTKTIMCSS